MRSILAIVIFGCLFTKIQAQDIFEAARKGDTAMAEKLLTFNPDTLNKVNESGFSPLIIAAYRGQADMVSYLLHKGASVDYISPEGTALMAACYKNDLEIAKVLIERDANVNLQSGDGSTALIFSVLNRNVELISLLLKYGANKTIRDSAGNTALSHAKKRALNEIIPLLE